MDNCSFPPVSIRNQPNITRSVGIEEFKQLQFFRANMKGLVVYFKLAYRRPVYGIEVMVR